MKSKTPIKSIRAYCLECSGGSPKEVRLCVIPECPLYPYRLGKNPNRGGEGHQEGGVLLKNTVPTRDFSPETQLPTQDMAKYRSDKNP